MTQEQRNIQEAMGNQASESEAIAMEQLLNERGLNWNELDDREFFALVQEAVCRVK